MIFAVEKRSWLNEALRGGLVAAALAAAMALCPAHAAAQADDPASAAETGAREGSQTLVDRMSRIFLLAVESPFRGGGEDHICRTPVSEQDISKEVLQAFAASLDEAWDRPKGAAAKTAPTVMLEVCLGEQGDSLRSPFLVQPSGALNRAESEALVKALEAVDKVAPLHKSPDKVERWRRILVLFDPLSGSSDKPKAGSQRKGAAEGASAEN